MKRIFFKTGLVIQVLLVFAHLYNNRNGLPIPAVDEKSRELIQLMHTYEIQYPMGSRHTLFQTIWGYDLTWASLVIFTILISITALLGSSSNRAVGRNVAVSHVVLWLFCTLAALVYWSPPQQIFFGVLFLVFLISAIFEWRAPKAKSARVCVVGAGVSGLTAAYELTKKGYVNITVLEKNNYVGGKCKTDIEDDLPFDFGGHEMLAGYYDAINLGKELNAPTRRSIPPVVYDSNQGKYLNFVQSATASGKFNKIQVMVASLKYLWLVGVTFRRYAQPSTGYKDMPKELTMNLDEWLNYRKLNAIRDILVFVIKVQGYGQFTNTPACYLIKFQGFRNWLSLLLSGMGIDKTWPRVFTYGMQNFCERMAATIMDVRTGVNIVSIVRESGGIKVFLEGKTQPLLFDKLIVSTQLDGNALRFLDLDPAEKALFSQFRSYPFYTTFAKVEGLDAGVVASNPMNNIEEGEYTGYIKDFTEEPYAIFFSLALNDRVNGQVVKEKINAVLERVVPYQGVKPKVLEFMKQNEWHYFPHIPGGDVAGTYNAIEALQGKKNTYFASSGLTFECVGNCVAYSKWLIDKNF
ncbi:MAG: FAD-dependent oxidoreductase [Cyclobacteriaceae bacterium]|nr:FAD-dependent oxidoreductase [Cyclobacteriaceae bacterium]